jgi:hypothetical protein
MRTFSGVWVSLLVLAAALAAPSVAQSPVQTTFTIDAQVIPNKAGTPKKPQGVKLKVSAQFHSPPGVDPPVVTRAYALFPRHGNWNGGKYPKCTLRILQREGVDGCPKKSRIGHADATAYADNVITRPDIELFNGGQKRVFAYVTLYNPAFVQEPIPVRVQELKSGPWKYKVSFEVPSNLQVVAGVPIRARSIKGWVGRGNLIESTSCPKNRRWPYELTAFYTEGEPYTHRDSVSCRPSGS